MFDRFLIVAESFFVESLRSWLFMEGRRSCRWTPTSAMGLWPARLAVVVAVTI